MIVTPMFLGGADNSSTAEMRVPSIRGALRYWFRALAGRTCGDDLSKVRLMEEVVFGSTNQAGAVRIKIENPGHKTRGVEPAWHCGSGLAYLGGQGLFAWDRNARRQKLSRPCLEPGGTFDLVMQGPRVELAATYASLLMLVRFGGLGSRSRKGFGSLSAVSSDLPHEKWPNLCLPDDPSSFGQSLAYEHKWSRVAVEHLCKCLGKLSEEWSDPSLADFRGDVPGPSMALPDFPSFSCVRARIFMVTRGGARAAFGSFGDWLDPMNQLGGFLREIRETNQRSANPPYVSLTKDYVNTVRPFMIDPSVANKDAYADVFGLPIHFRSSGRGAEATVTWRKTTREHELTGDQIDQEEMEDKRRASPIFMSFSRAEKWMCLSFLVFGSRFLPDGAEEIVIPKSGCVSDTPLVLEPADTISLGHELFSKDWASRFGHEVVRFEEGNW